MIFDRYKNRPAPAIRGGGPLRHGVRNQNAMPATTWPMVSMSMVSTE